MILKLFNLNFSSFPTSFAMESDNVAKEIKEVSVVSMWYHSGAETGNSNFFKNASWFGRVVVALPSYHQKITNKKSYI